MKPANYHPHARSELIESALFYEGRNPGLGERFLQAVKSTETALRKTRSGASLMRWGRASCGLNIFHTQ